MGEWRGPLQSVRGVHLVRVGAPSAMMSRFEELERYLRQDWTWDRQRAPAARLAELLQN